MIRIWIILENLAGFKMQIEDWFDVHNKEHLAAWKHLSTKGTWPVGFVPYDDVELGPHWQVNIMSIMANAWLDEKLNASALDLGDKK